MLCLWCPTSLSSLPRELLPIYPALLHGVMGRQHVQTLVVPTTTGISWDQFFILLELPLRNIPPKITRSPFFILLVLLALSQNVIEPPKSEL